MLSTSLTFAAALSLAAAAPLSHGSSRLSARLEPQFGTNDCGTTDSQSANCQTAHLNNINDFCLWAPPTPAQSIGDSERVEVAWCVASGHGTRIIPQGTIQSAHYLETPHYTQITGRGALTSLNIQAGDAGGELDPHGADGQGNPIGAKVFSNGVEIKEWTSFISDSEFCFRICKDAPDAWLWCQHIYDIQGCAWNEPGNYGPGFDTCDGDSTTSPPGIYVNNGQTSTYQQGDGSTPAPPAHTAGASSNCRAVQTLVGGNVPAAVTTTPAPAPTSTPITTTVVPTTSSLPTSAVASSEIVATSSVVVAVVSTSTTSATPLTNSTSSITASNSTTPFVTAGVNSTLSKNTSTASSTTIVTPTPGPNSSAPSGLKYAQAGGAIVAVWLGVGLLR